MTEEKTILYHWAIARFKHPTHQIVFCKQAALKYIACQDNYEI